MSRASLVELTNLCVICDGSRVLVQRDVRPDARRMAALVDGLSALRR